MGICGTSDNSEWQARSLSNSDNTGVAGVVISPIYPCPHAYMGDAASARREIARVRMCHFSRMRGLIPLIPRLSPGGRTRRHYDMKITADRPAGRARVQIPANIISACFARVHGYTVARICAKTTPRRRWILHSTRREISKRHGERSSCTICIMHRPAGRAVTIYFPPRVRNVAIKITSYGSLSLFLSLFILSTTHCANIFTRFVADFSLYLASHVSGHVKPFVFYSAVKHFIVCNSL